MTTPNPRGCTDSSATWDYLAIASRIQMQHWSFDDAAHRRSVRQNRRMRDAAICREDAARLLSRILSAAEAVGGTVGR